MNIIPLSTRDPAARARMGGKGASLSRLIEWGVPVPDGFVVIADAGAAGSAAAFKVATVGLAPDIGPFEPAVTVASAAPSAEDPLASDLASAILGAWQELGGGPVAVRSSAAAEDLAGASFAGQYESFLNVGTPDALLIAIRRCRASASNARARSYQEKHQLESGAMAVIVQRMVPADAAGVLFTVDPLTQRRDRMFLEVAPGVGEALVSGLTRGESRTLTRTGHVVARSGPRLSLLTDAQLRELGQIALLIETRAGSPQDVEFAFAGGRLAILQARPITTLAETLPPAPPLSFVDRTLQPIAFERYGVSPRPLDNVVFARMVGAAAYAAKQVGLEIADADLAAFRREIWRQRYRLPQHRPTARLLLASWSALQLLNRDWVRWWEQGPGRVLRQISTPADLRALDDTRLLDRAAQILTALEEPTNQRFHAAMVIQEERWLRAIVILAVGRAAADGVMSELMTGIHSPAADANDALWSLSRVLRGDDRLRRLVRADDWTGLASTAAGREFELGFERFLEAYGHREGAGFYLSAPTWRHDPAPVRRILRTLIEVEQRLPLPPDTHEQARARVEQRLRWFPWLRRRFVHLVAQFRLIHEFREISHLDLCRPLHAVQEIVAEANRRLRSRGIFSTSDDIFYLTFDELRTALTGEVRDWNAHVRRRRATYRLVNARWQADRQPHAPRGAVLRGVGVSPGVAHGPARLVLDESQFDRLQPGEIMICRYSNPSWTPLFLTAAAVVAETGGAASHAAIVAREYGLPAVMSVDGITQLVRDGDELQVDGGTGRVTKFATSTPLPSR